MKMLIRQLGLCMIALLWLLPMNSFSWMSTPPTVPRRRGGQGGCLTSPSPLLSLENSRLVPSMKGWNPPLQSVSNSESVIPSSLTTTTATTMAGQEVVTTKELNAGVISTKWKTVLTPLLDFTKPETIDKIDRLDDVIMGGISTSSVMFQKDDNTAIDDLTATTSRTTSSSRKNSEGSFAKWFGVCREDGGGFCGWRTNPLQNPIMVPNDASGFYITCKLASDNDADRRVWKFSTRTRPDRGEQLYQAPVTIVPKVNGDDGWATVQIPFQSFRLARGPRTVNGAPPLNVTNGIYQIGMTMSKFVFGNVTQELDNFRPGFFQLNIREIGIYRDVQDEASPPLLLSSTTTRQETSEAPLAVQALTKQESLQKRPMLITLLLPLLRILFFSEQSQRRKSALKLLMQRRGLSRIQAIMFGLTSRAQSFGYWTSLRQTCQILAIDVVRSVLSTTSRLLLLYPLRAVGAVVGWMKSSLGGRDKSKARTTSRLANTDTV